MEAELDNKDYKFIVIDPGSAYIKAGYSGNDTPDIVIPTAIGKQEEKKDGKQASIRIGNQIDLKNLSGKVNFPVERGQIKDSNIEWDNMQTIWEYIIREGFHQDPSNANILVTYNFSSSREYRERLATTFLEKIGVNSLGLVAAPTLSLFATGRTKGLVIEAGEGLTSIAPIFEGYALPHAVKVMQVAGSDITSYIQQRLEHLITPA